LVGTVARRFQGLAVSLSICSFVCGFSGRAVRISLLSAAAYRCRQKPTKK
jgi:hypothetical protein